MPFTPTFNATFAQPIPQNVLDLVRANEAEALAWANGGTVMDGFKEFLLSRPKQDEQPHLPAIVVYRRRTGKIENQNGELLSSVSEFAVEIAVRAATAEDAIAELEKRVMAVDAIIRTAAAADLLKDFPDATGIDALVDITEHVYGNVVPDGTASIRAAALTLTVEITEAGE